MSVRTILVIIVALATGGAAAVGVNALRGPQLPPQETAAPQEVVREEKRPEEERITIVVATVDLSRFGVITADQVKLREFPKSFAPGGAANRIEDVVDRVLDSSIGREEPIMNSRLVPREAGRGLAAIIPPGMRAVTISTPTVASTVGGFALPGSRVDVLFTLKDTVTNSDSTGGGSTTTLLQNVEILAVDQKVDIVASGKSEVKEMRSVTLLVTPDQAAKLDLGQNLGSLHLALRSPLDKATGQTVVALASDVRYHRGKALDERIKDMLSAFGKMIPEAKNLPRPLPPTVKEEPVVKKKDEPLPAPKIRTLHGVHPGVVFLD